jgi:pyroglutamyl-peptidase
MAGDRRLLICGFGAFPNVPANPSALVVGRLRAEDWSPDHAPADYALLPTTWSGAAETLRASIHETGATGVLLTGVAAGAAAFRVELRARNRGSLTAPDADGAVRHDERIEPLGPAALRTTAPAEAMLAGIRAAGLPAEPSSDAGDYLCNFTLYHLLVGHLDAAPACPLAFLHLPPAPEAPPDVVAGGRCFGLDDLTLGVKAAAGVMARTLAFLPADRLNGGG